MLAPVVLGLGLGARRGEIAALTWSRIGDDGVVTVAEALREISAADIRRGGTKTGKVRRVKLPAYALAELRAWKIEQAEQLFRLGIRQGPDTPVCTDPAGRPLSPTRISDSFRAVKKGLGLPITFHGLRHTSASVALAAGATIKEVQERLGNNRPSLTLDVYSHAIQGVADDAAERLDKVMRTAGSKAGSKTGSKTH
jgi:integrase